MAVLVGVVVFWDRIWPYLLAAVALGGIGVLGWWGRRRLREIRRQEAIFQAEQRIRDSNRTLEKADRLSGEDFERLVAGLLREGGCTGVRRVGGRGDRGADIVGVLPDGRSMVVQCKRYATNRSVGSGDMQRLLGTRTDFGAEVAVLVTVTRFTSDAEAYAKQHGIITIGRHLLSSWLKGATVESLIQTGGGGQGDRQHLRTWQQAYGRRGKGGRRGKRGSGKPAS